MQIQKKPNEIADPIRFDQDESHATYDPEYANRFWRILVHFQFRARFIGKCSPVHFSGGAPDLAVTRFSGRTPSILAVFLTYRTEWRGRLTRTKSAAAGLARRRPYSLSRFLFLCLSRA